MKENLGVKGYFEIEVRDKEGNLKAKRISPNTVTNAGKAEIAGLILTDVTGVNDFDYLALGTGTTTPSATDTALVAELYRTAGTGTRITTSVANDTAQLSGSFSMTTTANIAEVGIFNSSSGGVLLARSTFSAIATQNGDIINAIYKTQVS